MEHLNYTTESNPSPRFPSASPRFLGDTSQSLEKSESSDSQPFENSQSLLDDYRYKRDYACNAREAAEKYGAEELDEPCGGVVGVIHENAPDGIHFVRARCKRPTCPVCRSWKLYLDEVEMKEGFGRAEVVYRLEWEPKDWKQRYDRLRRKAAAEGTTLTYSRIEVEDGEEILFTNVSTDGAVVVEDVDNEIDSALLRCNEVLKGLWDEGKTVEKRQVVRLSRNLRSGNRLHHEEKAKEEGVDLNLGEGLGKGHRVITLPASDMEAFKVTLLERGHFFKPSCSVEGNGWLQFSSKAMEAYYKREAYLEEHRELPEFELFEWMDYATEIDEIRYCSETYVRGTKEELARRREEAYEANARRLEARKN